MRSRVGSEISFRDLMIDGMREIIHQRITI
jgi:hypothetical protein